MQVLDTRATTAGRLAWLLSIAMVSTAGAGEADYFDLLSPVLTADSPAGTAPTETEALPLAVQWTEDPATTPAAYGVVIEGPTGLDSEGVVLVSDAVQPEPLLTPEPQLMAPPTTTEGEAPTLAPQVMATPGDDPLTRPLFELTVDTAAEARLLEQMAKIPDDFSIDDLSIERFGSWYAPAEEASSRPPRFAPALYTFAAPAVYHRPLYFEQPNVERYGQHVRVWRRDELTQSALSAAHFFATVPVLPYKIGAGGGFCGMWGNDCSRNYVLGTYRPGSCNPHQLVKPKWSWPGLVYQGVATTGLVYLIP